MLSFFCVLSPRQQQRLRQQLEDLRQRNVPKVDIDALRRSHHTEIDALREKMLEVLLM